MSNRRVRRSSNYATSHQGTSETQMVRRGAGRQRKDTTSEQDTSKAAPSKRSRAANYPESDDEVQESRPRRKSARYVTYEESDSDFEDSSIQKKTGRGTIDSKKDDLLSSSSSKDSSSSEPELDIADSDVEEESDNEQAESAIEETIPKSGGTRNARDENKRKRKNYTEKQRKILQAMLRETHLPSLEQRKKLAEETNLNMRQVRKWFDNERQNNPEWAKARESNPEWLKKREGVLSGEKKVRMEQAFAACRRPDKDMIASLASELGIPKIKVIWWFSTKRSRNPIPGENRTLLCEDDARPILMEFFQRNPNFRDYKNPELKEKTGWSRNRLREWFETCRKENGIAPLPYKEAELILMEIFERDPMFSDFENVELNEKIQWSTRRIKEWFSRQRNLKSQNQFTNAMEKFFETRQFHEKTDEALKSESGGGWKKISNWLVSRRKAALESFLKKEHTWLPNEMAFYESLYEKYDNPTHEDLILYIEMKENVNGDRFALYLVERWIVAKKLHPGDIDDEQEDGDFADSLDEEYLNDMELDHEIDEHEEGPHVDYQQEDEMEIDYYGNEIDRPREAQGDQEFRDQMEETVPQNPPPEVKDIPLLNSSREREQKPPIMNHNQKTFDDFPDETKNVPRFDLAPGYQSPEPPKN
ncbi:unnamed protein product [Caenorhabditis nigoni]